MRPISRLSTVSLVCLVFAGLVYLAGRLVGNHMVATGQAWEMAFYLSPLVFFVVDGVLVFGVVVALVSVVLGPGWKGRLQGVVAGFLNAVVLMLLPWH